MLYCAASAAPGHPLNSRPLRIHFVAIGGTGMAPLACLLQGQGHLVSGSDGPLYPPMSTLLETAGIRPLTGFRPENLDPDPDLVIIGNAVPRQNPEAVECERRGLPRLSMPEAVARFLLADRRPLVVAGTHGKTTTTSLAAWVWSFAGRDPGFLIGGVPSDLGVSFRQGGGERFLIEGDEYNASYFDREAKFLHYRPETLLLTSVEHDHADLYPTPESLLAAYARLVALVPPGGRIVACGDSDDVRAIAAPAKAPVVLYGESESCPVRLVGKPESHGAVMRFRLRDESGEELEVDFPLFGVHNATNALAVWAAARHDGIEPEVLRAALAGFHGVARRQQQVGEGGGVVVIDDFAHHPTAVEKTLASLRLRFPGRRLVACFEPRSLTAGRGFFEAGYERAFRDADVVLFAPIFHRDRLAPADRLDLETLVSKLERAGVRASALGSIDEVGARALELARGGDVVVTMSSGAFGGLAAKLAAAVGAMVPEGPG
ncbi:MAG: UDP-N-acetylmuramate--L-alanine ligase [Thermoanaerobaculia bacterium]